MTGLSVEIRAKAFGSAAVLDEISFRLAPGERAALLGPSGIGKTILLGLIAGFDRQFEGRIARPGGRLAMMFQTPRLLPWRTLAENIALVPGVAGLDRARALLAEVRLGDATEQFPEKVSLGMQRRAALARALAVSPALILMDEPLVSLDPAGAAAMRAVLIEALNRTGATALIATHDRREALMLTDRVLELGGHPARLVRDRLSPLDRSQREDAGVVEALHSEWFGETAFMP